VKEAAQVILTQQLEGNAVLLLAMLRRSVATAEQDFDMQ